MKVIGSNNKALRIHITLPVDANGDRAFDENGDPVKGRTAVEFSLPRFDSMSPDKFSEMMDGIAAAEKSGKSKQRSAAEEFAQSRTSELVSLRPFVDDDTYHALEACDLAELKQVTTYWAKQSNLTVGELLASSDS